MQACLNIVFLCTSWDIIMKTCLLNKFDFVLRNWRLLHHSLKAEHFVELKRTIRAFWWAKMYKCYIDYLTYCLTFIHVQVHWRLEETVFLYQHACNNIVCNKSRGIFFKRKNNVKSMWEIQKGFIIRFWNKNWEKKRLNIGKAHALFIKYYNFFLQ